jgi:hypothetical protein
MSQVEGIKLRFAAGYKIQPPPLALGRREVVAEVLYVAVAKPRGWGLLVPGRVGGGGQ